MPELLYKLICVIKNHVCSDATWPQAHNPQGRGCNPQGRGHNPLGRGHNPLGKSEDPWGRDQVHKAEVKYNNSKNNKQNYLVESVTSTYD